MTSEEKFIGKERLQNRPYLLRLYKILYDYIFSEKVQGIRVMDKAIGIWHLAFDTKK
jgi:hypothetical protein